MTHKARKYLDWFLLMFINFLWATQAPVIKLIGDRLGPVAISFFPMVLSILLCLPALWSEQHRSAAPLHWRWRDARYFVAAGLFAFFLQLSYTLGAQRTLAANAALITLSIPVLAAVAASVVLKEKFNAVRVFGFVAALGGVLMTSVSDIRGASFGSGKYLVGNLLFLAACAGSALYNTYCKLLVEKKYSELQVLIYTSTVACAASIPAFIWLEPIGRNTLVQMDRVAAWGVLELAILPYSAAMLLFFYILKRLDVAQATLSTYVLPFFIGLLAVLVLKESITLVMIVGGVVILFSTLVVTVYEGDILAWLARRRNAGLDKSV